MPTFEWEFTVVIKGQGRTEGEAWMDATDRHDVPNDVNPLESQCTGPIIGEDREDR
jgi:hypothetical protein